MEEELGLARLVSSYTLPHQNSQPGERGRQTARSKVLSVTTPPMVGPTWPRVRFTLGSDCLPVLFQGTASLRLDYGLTAFIVTARIRCLVIGVVLVRCSLTCLCGPEGYTLPVYAALRAIPLITCTSTSMVVCIP